MKKYSIGLDIGTTSVGWSVIDSLNFKLIRKGNKNLWGARLFEQGETAVSRRLARGTRRRYDRRRQRISFLKDEFRDEMKKLDPMFFMKLETSFYHQEDINNIKFDFSKEEKEQLKDYNTIYHLRYDLMNNSQKFDLRLVYRAIHHIIKYRGNFLYEGDFKLDNINIQEDIRILFQMIIDVIHLDEYDLEKIDFNLLEEFLSIKSITDKKVKLKTILKNVFNEKVSAELSKALAGSKFDIIKLLTLEIDDVKSMELSFRDSSYDEKGLDFEIKIGDAFEVIEKLKNIYDYIFLKNIFNGKDEMSISKAMIDNYDKHKLDIKFLKDILMGYRKEYAKIFKNGEKEVCLYEKYIHNQLIYDDFKKELLKILSSIEIEEDKLNILQEELEKESFLPKITDTSNGKYPYQLNKDELIKILENQGKYYPFLLNKCDEKTYKIVRLLEFRIPYYVGPLNTTTNNKNKENENAWIIRKTNEKITPYNFNEVVDIEKSAEEFIMRMISNCTYLLEEKVIPSNSILYSKFKVLNELKSIKINNQKLSVDNLMRVYNDLFLKQNKTITGKEFERFIRANELVYINNNECIIEGYILNKKFANNMKSYVDFFGVDGFFKDTSYKEDDADDIIKLITVFEDKKILENSIKGRYHELSTDVVERIVKKNYKGWSNLSKKLLTKITYIDPSCNIGKSILDLMVETSDNFMQIISKDSYGFQTKIEDENIKNISNKLSYDVVKKLATSPANKKGIYQALKVVEELVEYMGYEPDNISVEMARNEEEKTRKSSKHDYLKKIYAGLKNEISNYKELNKELNSVDNNMLQNSEKLFLYFIQEGKSLYSGTRLSIDDLESYEVDHIVPRTLIKDDSKDNKALVLKEENQLKSDMLNVPDQFKTSSNYSWWKSLLNKKLISQKKYYALIKKEYSEDDIKGFINRQLVETRQICKHVATILNKMYSETEIVYLHADLSSNFRKKYQLYKFRDINDNHHAHDAYLAAVLGSYKKNCLYDFDKKKLIFLTKDKKYKYKNSFGYVLNSIENNQYVEYKQTGEALLSKEEFVNIVVNTLYQNDCIISRKTEIKTGELYNQTKNKKGMSGVCLKDNLPTEFYGAYTSLNPSYGIVVKYTNKNKEEQRLIGMPIYYSVKSKSNEALLNDYIKNTLKLKDTDTFEIIKDKIPLKSQLDWDGQICTLVGLNSNVAEVCNGKQFYFSKDNYKKWKYTLNKLLNNNKISHYYKDGQKHDINEIYENQLNEIIDYIILKVEQEYKLYLNLVEDMKNMVINDLDTLDKKELFIKELLKLLKCNSVTANLKFLSPNYSMTFARKHNRTIKNAIIINQSVTGIKEVRNEF